MSVLAEIIVRLQNKDKEQQAMSIPKPNLDGRFVAHMTAEQCNELKIDSKIDVRYVFMYIMTV